MTNEESENQVEQEITFVIEKDPLEDSDRLVATRKRDKQRGPDGRVPGVVDHGTGETPLEAIETLVSGLRANREDNDGRSLIQRLKQWRRGRCYERLHVPFRDSGVRMIEALRRGLNDD